MIEENGVRILTDPGIYSTSQNEVKDIDLIIITHEHPDHFHLDSLKIVTQNNPAAKIITNKGVGALLDKEGISHEVVEDGQNYSFHDLLIEGFGKNHAPIYPTVPSVINTGYFIANKFFYPGDALTNPNKPVEILALPVVGPWLKIAEAIDYAKSLKPKICFPVHDGMLRPERIGPVHKLPEAVLAPAIKFVVLAEGVATEL